MAAKKRAANSPRQGPSKRFRKTKCGKIRLDDWDVELPGLGGPEHHFTDDMASIVLFLPRIIV